MFRLIVLACALACAVAGLLPLGYSGLTPYGTTLAGAYATPYAAPFAAQYAAPYAMPYAAAHPAFPTYQTVSHTVDIAAEPVEQHGYVIKY